MATSDAVITFIYRSSILHLMLNMMMKKYNDHGMILVPRTSFFLSILESKHPKETGRAMAETRVTNRHTDWPTGGLMDGQTQLLSYFATERQETKVMGKFKAAPSIGNR